MFTDDDFVAAKILNNSELIIVSVEGQPNIDNKTTKAQVISLVPDLTESLRKISYRFRRGTNESIEKSMNEKELGISREHATFLTSTPNKDALLEKEEKRAIWQKNENKDSKASIGISKRPAECTIRKVKRRIIINLRQTLLLIVLIYAMKMKTLMSKKTRTLWGVGLMLSARVLRLPKTIFVICAANPRPVLPTCRPELPTIPGNTG
ncbi:hypothetical protein WA026_013772 [Henosepilachna vigintioctopunctata]|uniref:Uncharacterized protein n=1 Tax=Henosepilachna vigintioctopunctata TaxID=420089 RepID=A0AAW1UXT9_9CUCU